MDSSGCIPRRPSKHRRFPPRKVGDQTQRPGEPELERIMIGTRTARPDGSRRASYEALLLFAFCGLPALLTAYVLYYIVQGGALATDFHQEFWPAATRLIHGLSPYAVSWQHISRGVAFPYPALTAIVFVPLALLPHGVADGVFTAINIAAVLLTLRLLDVRDRRVYGIVLLWPVVVFAWQAANLTLLLGLGIAWMWRKRDQPVIVGVVVAVLISLKPFVWPVGLWLLATRRYAAAVYALASGLVINLVVWGIIGFSQLKAYEQVANEVTDAMYRRGYDLIAFGMRLGTGHTAAYAIALIVAVLVALGCVYTGRRGDSQAALTLCIALSLLATPVLWTHYFSLLIVLLAIARPRLCPLWFLPMLLWLCPSTTPDTWQIALALGVGAAIVASVVSRASGLTGVQGSRRLRFGWPAVARH
jgi:alpha-1,2-mannosyltransferase